MNRVQNKTAIVTGGAKGIGRATSMRLAEEGAKVAITDIDDDAGKETAKKIQDAGGEASYWHLDMTRENDVKDVFAEIADKYDGIDVLVNNAGISGKDVPTHEMSLEEWRRVMDINVDGVFLGTKHAVPYMLDNGKGSIINLSSIYGLIGAADIPHYHASKGAVRLMTKNDALEYAKKGIRINSVHPGFIRTPLVEEFASREGDKEENLEALNQLHPIGHIGEPEDIANGILYLASDEAKFVTGSELVIDGGYTAQ